MPRHKDLVARPSPDWVSPITAGDDTIGRLRPPFATFPAEELLLSYAALGSFRSRLRHLFMSLWPMPWMVARDTRFLEKYMAHHLAVGPL
jgi:hypothetical protein